MALQNQGQKDSGQYSVYNLPTSNLDLLRTRGEKYEICLHPKGQRWGDKVRWDYENHEQIDKTACDHVYWCHGHRRGWCNYQNDFRQNKN